MVPKGEKVLVVDDEEQACQNIQRFLDQQGYIASHALNGMEGLERVRVFRPEAVLLDIRMPGMDGMETLKRIMAVDKDCAVIMVTAVDDVETAVSAIRDGASDFLRKPVNFFELAGTLESVLEKRSLVLENREYQQLLEAKVVERTAEIEMTRDATILALTKLAEYRDLETGGHLERIREYTRELALRLEASGAYNGGVDKKFVENIYKGSPLHDIGKVGVPDAILQKPGPLSTEEFKVMKNHAAIGGRTLFEAEEKLVIGHETSFLSMAKEIAFCHHEKFDGSGYPEGMQGEEIPLAARIMALADVYDALISKRIYKPAMKHEEAREIIVGSNGTHFDPQVVQAFKESETRFEEIKDGFKDERE